MEVGVRFSFGKVLIVAGKYSINRCDLKYKAMTFREGDSRKIIFSADDTFKTFFVVDRKKQKKRLTLSLNMNFFCR